MALQSQANSAIHFAPADVPFSLRNSGRIRVPSEYEGTSREDVPSANHRGSKSCIEAVVLDSARHIKRHEFARNLWSSGVSLASHETGEWRAFYEPDPV